MLESLTVRDFQAHAKLTIKFDPHVTTIVGPSDRGKSAVLRALKWLATNRPGGESFVRTGGRIAKVFLKLDGREIRRAKSKGKNTYHVDGHKLKAFGAEVPASVAKLLNLTDVNFQSQHDAPFWFSDSAGTVSRSLNQIINLGIIDDTLAFLATKLRAASSQSSVATEQQAVCKTAWEKLKPVKAVNRELVAVEVLGAVAVQARATATLLGQMVTEAIAYADRADKARAEHLAGLRVLEKGEQWGQTRQKRIQLAFLLDSAASLTAVANRPLPNLGQLEALDQQTNALWERREALAGLLAEAERLMAVRDNALANSKAGQTAFERLLGERCLLCNQKIKTR